jgi:hypothetical protein
VDWIWIIIVIVAAIAQGLGKLKKEDDSPDVEEPPVVITRKKRPPVSQTTRRPVRSQMTPPLGEKRNLPPPAPPVTETWQVDSENLRDFIEQATRPKSRREPVMLPPRAVPPPPPMPEPEVSAKPVRREAPAAKAAPARSAQWTAALRDRSNLRNIIIASEIIGQPRSLRELEN